MWNISCITHSNRCQWKREKRQGSRKPAVYITDADFADDLALISNHMEQAHQLLSRLEMAAETFSCMQTAKRWGICYSTRMRQIWKKLSGDLLKQVHDFKYLGSWISDSKNEIEVRMVDIEGAKQVRKKFGNQNWKKNLRFSSSDPQ